MDINSYGSAISKVAPGTFVPDIDPQLPRSEPLPDDSGLGSESGGGVSFKDTLLGAITRANDQVIDAQQKATALATGDSNDLEGAVKATEEAGLAMQLVLSARNKILQSYTELSQMQF